MKLFKYGIIMKRIGAEDLELLRNWRNAEPIRKQMQYRKHITKSAQQRWFKSINNTENFYYIIYYENKPIGLFNEKNINWQDRTSETGLFIADDAYLATHIPLMVSLAQAETGFRVFHGQYSLAKVSKNNFRAKQYMLSFGYEMYQDDDDEFQIFKLSAEGFERKGGRLLKAMNHLYPDNNTLRILFEEADYKSGIAPFLEAKAREYNAPLERYITDEGVWYSLSV